MALAAGLAFHRLELAAGDAILWQLPPGNWPGLSAKRHRGRESSPARARPHHTIAYTNIPRPHYTSHPLPDAQFPCRFSALTIHYATRMQIEISFSNAFLKSCMQIE